jgi:RNA polymerase sigma-70 factor (ECF subfamily)
VLAALRRLPAEQAAALVLVDVEDHPVEEAARILDVPVGTVKSRCARGRARLARELAGDDGNPRAAGNVPFEPGKEVE